MASTVYEDVLDFDLGSELDNLRDEKVKLEVKVRRLEEDVQKLMRAVSDIHKTKNQLIEQISSLFNTAKREIDRKDKIIRDLRREKEDILFRRYGNTQIKTDSFQLEQSSFEPHDVKLDLIHLNDSDRFKRRRSRSKSIDRLDTKKSRQFDDRKQFQPRSSSRERYTLKDEDRRYQKPRSKSRERERDREREWLEEREKDLPRERQRGSFYRSGRNGENSRSRYTDRFNSKDRYDSPHNYRDEIKDRDRRWPDSRQENQNRYEPESINTRNYQHLFPSSHRDNYRQPSTDLEDGELREASEKEILKEVGEKEANILDRSRKFSESYCKSVEKEVNQKQDEVCDIKDVDKAIEISGENICANKDESKIQNFDMKTYKIPKKSADEQSVKIKLKNSNESKEDVKVNKKEDPSKNKKSTPKSSQSKKNDTSKNKSKNEDSTLPAGKTTKDSSSESVKKPEKEKKDVKSKESKSKTTSDHRSKRNTSKSKVSEKSIKSSKCDKSEESKNTHSENDKAENNDNKHSASTVLKELQTDEQPDRNSNTNKDDKLPTFQNILKAKTDSNDKKTSVKLVEQALHLTGEGEIPILHIEDMSFGSTSVIGIGEKNLYNVYLNDSAKTQTDGVTSDNLSFSNYLKDVTNKEGVSESKMLPEISESLNNAIQDNLPELMINNSESGSIMSTSTTSTPNVSRVPVRKRRRRAVMMMDE